MKVNHLPYPVISHPVVIGKFLYVGFCNCKINFSFVLCFLWNGVGVDRICAPEYVGRKTTSFRSEKYHLRTLGCKISATRNWICQFKSKVEMIFTSCYVVRYGKLADSFAKHN